MSMPLTDSMPGMVHGMAMGMGMALKTFIDATRSTAVDTMQIVPVVYYSLWDVVFRYVNYAPSY